MGMLVVLAELHDGIEIPTSPKDYDEKARFDLGKPGEYIRSLNCQIEYIQKYGKALFVLLFPDGVVPDHIEAGVLATDDGEKIDIKVVSND